MDADDKAPTDEPSAADASGSPFTAAELQVELRDSRSALQPLQEMPATSPEPANPPDPPLEESPFTTPEVEEVERERPSTDEGDSEHRDA